MVSRIHSAVLNGLEVMATEVEVGFSRGIPGIVIVGLPDNAVKESRERLKLAVGHANFAYPQATKIVINLSPADVRKEGSALDLPMAVGIVGNQYRLKSPAFSELLFYGELNLDGGLNPVKGVLNIALFARENGWRGIVIPFANREEAQFVSGIEVYALKNLTEVIELVEHPERFAPRPTGIARPAADTGAACENDFAEIQGQHLAKRAMEIAAAGFHNLLMIGAPGAGKSMIAKALPSILPEMTDDEILETSLIYSAAGLLDAQGAQGGLVRRRPFRSPHHTISDVGISGGGKYPVPGEISLAHNGVLFLDEIPYFKRSALEVLRQPLEDGRITVSRSLTSATFPARFMLVAAMNPSQDAVGLGEAGFSGPALRQRYYAKLSRPLLDRIDLQIEVKKVKLAEITSPAPAESSAVVRARVAQARQRQHERFRVLKRRVFANGQMRNAEIRRFCALDDEGGELLRRAVERFDLSARGYFRILKVARTIADLQGAETIAASSVQEALQYRSLDLGRF
ncbi:MAG: YifB family Mg chelatase-like AAA ATPase [Acidobacteria bacterium]|nr:YifB family Mg chelatase-like AAA ATPase [Acidobacteriota bacterium]